MNDSDERAPWTVKGMRIQVRRTLTDYAMRHDTTVAEAVAEAVRLLIERERGTEVILASKPNGTPPANQADPLDQCRAWAELLVRLHDAGVAPPAYLTRHLFRTAALALGCTPPKPPAKRTEPAGLLADRRESWQENSRLADAGENQP